MPGPGVEPPTFGDTASVMINGMPIIYHSSSHTPCNSVGLFACMQVPGRRVPDGQVHVDEFVQPGEAVRDLLWCLAWPYGACVPSMWVCLDLVSPAPPCFLQMSSALVVGGCLGSGEVPALLVLPSWCRTLASRGLHASHCIHTLRVTVCECRYLVAGLMITGCMRAHPCLHASCVCTLT